MSEEQVQQVAQTEAEGVVASAVPVAPVELDMNTAVKEVIQNAQHRNGLRRGLRECIRALDRDEARICFLAGNCDEKSYVSLVRAMCTENKTDLVIIETGTQLGEWCGLIKTDAEGQTKKTVRTSCVVITDYGKDSDALKWLQEHITKSKAA